MPHSRKQTAGVVLLTGTLGFKCALLGLYWLLTDSLVEGIAFIVLAALCLGAANWRWRRA